MIENIELLSFLENIKGNEVLRKVTVHEHLFLPKPFFKTFIESVLLEETEKHSAIYISDKLYLILDKIEGIMTPPFLHVLHTSILLALEQRKGRENQTITNLIPWVISHGYAMAHHMEVTDSTKEWIDIYNNLPQRSQCDRISSHFSGVVKMDIEQITKELNELAQSLRQLGNDVEALLESVKRLSDKSG